MSTVEFPEKMQGLFEPKRYKVFYGGRGGAKSWAVARALLIKAAEQPMRILCAREFQKSIKDSVHKLLADQITMLGLDSLYEIQQASIKSAVGSEFFFEGLRHNISNIKSYEGVDIVWVEEAQSVSKTSWDVLIPTIRKAGSEIWVTYNPDLEDDNTHQRFVVTPPKESTVVKVNWSDNPWFPEVLRREMEELKERDPDAWLHIWEGHCRQCLDGAVYADELRKAKEEGRITRVPYDASKPVDTFWDLGWADNTSIWFVQAIGMEVRVIDFYQNSLQPIQHYQQMLQNKGYVYGKDHLPHDARAKQLGTGRSIEEILRGAGRKVEIVPNLSIADGINAARTIFTRAWFDADKCADGLNSLRHYRYDVDQDTGKFSKAPLHDWSSHACLAPGSMVKMAKGYKKIEKVKPGDQVWTPAGCSTVLHAGEVKKTSTLVHLALSNGHYLACTPEHKVLTQKGFVRADALRYNDKTFTGKEFACNLVTLLSMAIGLGFRETITGVTAGHSQGRLTYIGRFGNIITAQSQAVLKFITKTGIRLTTVLRTSCWWMRLSTSEPTQYEDMLRATSSPRAERRLSWRLNGTGHQMVENGTRCMPSNHGSPESGIDALVKNVGSRLSLLILRGLSFATPTVKRLRFVSEEDKVSVYDLTVKNHACYQANGMLVSNSDAFRYLGVGFRENRPPPKAVYRPAPSSWMGM